MGRDPVERHRKADPGQVAQWRQRYVMAFCRKMDWDPYRLERWQIKQIEAQDEWKKPQKRSG